MRVTISSILLFLFYLVNLNAQVCDSDPPLNPYLADSPWPTYHRNNYRQASTCLRGPMQGDSLILKYRSNIKGGTSPWTYISESYPNGNRVLLQSNSTHVFKFIDNGEEILAIDSLRIDFDPISSFGWNFLLGKHKTWYTYDPKYDPENNEFTRLFKLTDADTTDAYSEIIMLDTLNLGDYNINRVYHLGMNYDGQIVFNSDNDLERGYATVGIISPDFEILDTLRYTTTPDEITGHNAFPIDEHNAFYITTNKRLIKFKWDGIQLAIDWQAPYDFVNDGPTGTFAEGSGTTPTLIGWGESNDKLVVMSDGHDKNNLLAFWRELPAGWEGIPGMDIHFADSIRLPAAQSFSNLFQSIENSPTAYGYDIAIAQYNGFLGYDCENVKGVQKIHWDTLSNTFSIEWVNEDVNMNSVLTYSKGSNLVYGSGKEEDCNYYYYGLDWETGEVAFRYLLGPEGTFLDDPFYDGGNGNIIDTNGSIYFSGGGSIVKLEVVDELSNVEEHNPSSLIHFFPNPTRGIIFFDRYKTPIEQVKVFSMDGKSLGEAQVDMMLVDLTHLPAGAYILKANTASTIHHATIIKK